MAACVVQFVVAFSLNFAMAFLTLFIYAELGVGSLREAGLWAGTAQFLSSSSLALMSPVWGWLSDRIGGKKMLIRVLVAHSSVMGLLSVSTSVYHVLVLRLIHGITSGTSTVVMAIIASSVDEDRLPQAIGYQQSVMTTGFLLGPAVGGVMAATMGFRPCFLISSIMIAIAIPFVVWARFEERSRGTSPREMIRWQSFKEVGRDFIALLSIQAAFNFVSPILPLYLNEAGVAGEFLVQYTGAIMAMSGLAYAVSVPVTTRLFKRKAIPFMLAAASGVVFLQGFFRQALGFVALRTVQCFLHSAGPSTLLGKAGGRSSNKGLTMGILNSARFLGNAIGPFLSSSVAYATDLTTAFAVTASVSLLAAVATIPRRERHGHSDLSDFVESEEHLVDKTAIATI